MRLILNKGTQAPLALLLALVAGASSAEERLTRHLRLMGTEMRIEVLATDRPSALAATETAIRELEKAEARLSTWIPDSELSRLNEAAVGEVTRPSPQLYTELSSALSCARETGGAFDPGVGRLSLAWGLREGGRTPGESEISEAVGTTALGRVRLSDGDVVRLADVLLDEGGFGKGAGLDRALRAILAAPILEASFDLGGQLAVFGAGPFRVAVSHPDDRSQPAVEIEVDAGSVATTGNSERGVEIAGGRTHILDPRDGRPVADFGSVTVWAPQALRADCLSTALYVLGPDAALAWASGHDEVEALVLERRPTGGLLARVTAGLEDRIRAIASGVEVDVFGRNRDT